MGTIYHEIDTVLNTYKPISLSEMDSVKLMSRTDTKFIFNSAMICQILEMAKSYYKVLEINSTRQFQYITTYFDTPDLFMYNQHHNGKLNRYKVRQRRYDATGNEFFEIKFKNNKGRTIKSRIENNANNELNAATDKFLKKKTPFECCQLKKTILNQFIRITLVNNNMTERATLDYNLCFSDFHKERPIPQLGIAEIKQDSNSGPSPLITIMRELKIQPEGLSKYCLGVASLYDDVKINTFKPRLIKINNL
ncbi:MAG TPA: polyphosphate polymerase domain-containing protein [Bacteroidales bacterium]|nr:polyphosphate polymerase domain-containing protein [Bacteroidales bacterium]